MKKKNKYKLDKQIALAAKNIVAQAIVTYDIKTDEMKSLIAVRDDVEDERLQLRIARQLEGASRTVLPCYKEEMELLERLAKMGADIGVHDESCDCAKNT